MLVRLAYISGGFPIWPLVVAQSSGLFKRAGLNVEVTHTGSSIAQMQGLRDARFDLGLQLPDHIVRANLSGFPMKILAAQTHAPDVALVCSAGIDSLTALRARPIAVDGARTGYALLLRELLTAHGLSPGEILFQEVGDSAQRVQALESGAVSAALINPPLDRGLVAKGFSRITSTRTAFPDYPGPVMAARGDWVAENIAAARAMQQVWRESWEWLVDSAHEADAIAIAVGQLAADRDAATRALATLRAQGIPTIDGTGLRRVTELVARSENLKGPLPDPEDWFA